MRFANVFEVKNAPEGFLRFALLVELSLLNPTKSGRRYRTQRSIDWSFRIFR